MTHPIQYSPNSKADQLFLHVHKCIEKDYEANDNWMNQLKADPVMNPLCSDPRFQALLRKMKFKESPAPRA